MKRRNVLPFILSTGAVLTLPQLASAQVVDLNDAINKAGRQRMLSQRAAKGYLALGQKVRRDAAEKVLSASMALFDRQLVELKAFAPTPQIKATYDALEASWSDYKAALVGAAPSKAGASKVMALSGDVLRLAHQGTGELEASSGKPVGRLVNICGRQRMLSQRMAAYYLCASWDIQPQESTAEIAKSKREFLKAHEVLKSAPEATAAIKAELQLAETQFPFFESALKNLTPGASRTQQQSDVFTTSERILQVMNEVTGMYAKLA